MTPSESEQRVVIELVEEYLCGNNSYGHLYTLNDVEKVISVEIIRRPAV
jgi:hypothetical protein